MNPGKNNLRLIFFASLIALFLASCGEKKFDVIIRGGNLYDGTGTAPITADIGVRSDTIAFIGDLTGKMSVQEIDAKGLAVAPGFINMLSWATESLLIDGHSQSDIRQGVTLEVMGEGSSMGPLNARMKADAQREAKRAGEDFKIGWNTLDEYLRTLEQKGVSPNIASFVGATTVRVNVIGLEDRAPNEEELEKMKHLVDDAMDEGALGVGASLIYAPASYAKTDELIALCQVAGRKGGMYITHIRSEGNNIMKALRETVQIAKEAKLRAEVYHLKLAGERNWNKFDSVKALFAKANEEGVQLSADMYSYAAGATGLDAAMPPWLQEGGVNEWIRRMSDPAIRKKALAEMRSPYAGWENLMQMAGTPERMLLVEFTNDSLRRYTGKTLAEVAKIYGKSAEETAMDLVAADSTRVGTVYFMMSEENIRKQFALPFVSIGSDASSLAPEGGFLRSAVHPRAYGNVARFLGKYVRDEKVMTLQEGIHRLTGLPAEHLKILKRGMLKTGYFGDIVVFDPAKIMDHATFERPHQYSTGMSYVLVNGIVVLKNGEHTGATPGKVVRGPGWRKKE